MTRTRIALLPAIALALCLGACEQTKEQFDFSKKPPDEFAVVRRAPLAMPTELNLPKPQPGAPRPQELSATDLARDAILGEDGQPMPSGGNTVSGGEAVLLQKTGAANANGAIRARIDRETDEIAKEQAPGIDKIKGWFGQDTTAPAEVIDPTAEANRIREQRAAGKAVTGKGAATIEQE